MAALFELLVSGCSALGNVLCLMSFIIYYICSLMTSDYSHHLSLKKEEICGVARKIYASWYTRLRTDSTCHICKLLDNCFGLFDKCIYVFKLKYPWLIYTPANVLYLLRFISWRFNCHLCFIGCAGVDWQTYWARLGVIKVYLLYYFFAVYLCGLPNC